MKHLAQDGMDNLHEGCLMLLPILDEFVNVEWDKEVEVVSLLGWNALLFYGIACFAECEQVEGDLERGTDA